MKDPVSLPGLARLATLVVCTLLIPTGCKRDIPGAPTVQSIQVTPARDWAERGARCNESRNGQYGAIARFCGDRPGALMAAL